MSTFNLRNFLTENRLTSNSKKLQENPTPTASSYNHDDVAYATLLSDVSEDDFQAHITGRDRRGEFIIQHRAPETIRVMIEFKNGAKRQFKGNFLDVGIAAPHNEPGYGEQGFEQYMEFFYYDLPEMEGSVLRLEPAQEISHVMDVEVIDANQMDTGVFF